MAASAEGNNLQSFYDCMISRRHDFQQIKGVCTHFCNSNGKTYCELAKN